MTVYEALLPERPEEMHKGVRGGVVVVGGCDIYRGAPVLAARGALRAGCGLAVIFSDEPICAAAASSLPEAVFLSGLFGRTVDSVLELLSSWESRVDCMVLGPGLGRSVEAGEVVRIMMQTWTKPLVVDGDGLFWLPLFWDRRPSRDMVLLTPHEGEAAHLLGLAREIVSEDREAAARTIASRYGVVLLKGKRTLIHDGISSDTVEEGDQTLAIPGSGDVLSGAIAAFAASGASLFDSARLGAYVHGRAGRMISCESGIDGALASEVADAMPKVIGSMRKRGNEGKKTHRLG
ncbi:MAG: NAD(P)H-hydrate dehydratase [Synergistaceae bacterium]|nr:NAD(P)H-hydrate dehydratase [Synergistota bacterium]NLM70660.1 NAD(P)H-hydrate dehydratase [Synergistaceae bacterium]